MKKSYREDVIEKAEKEFHDFIEDIRETDEIEQAINKAYEITIKQELLDLLEYDMVENGLYNKSDIEKMLEIDNILDYLYNEWLDFDGNIRESLEYSFDLALDKIIKRGE